MSNDELYKLKDEVIQAVLSETSHVCDSELDGMIEEAIDNVFNKFMINATIERQWGKL